MIINSKETWWQVADETVPKLNDYARNFGIGIVDFNAALTALGNRDWQTVLRLCNFLWLHLPDNSSIRFGPFFDLCDLCSESWVFEETAE